MTETHSKIKRPHFENLDALRAIAALSVFVFHYFRDIQAIFPSLSANTFFKLFKIFADKGNLGVNLFFVLSGFLITYLILDEIKRNGKFNALKFIGRRCLRIWPLYFIVIGIGFLLFPIIFKDYYTVHNPWLFIFFLANFDEIYNGLNDSINFLTSPWSVAVEEQFYFIWAIIFAFIPKIKSIKIIHIISSLFILTFIFRIIHLDDERVIYYHTLSVCQDILMGALIGQALFYNHNWIQKIKNLSKWTTAFIYIIGIITCLAKNKLFIGYGIIIERFILASFFAFIILDQSQNVKSVFKLGSFKILNYLGKISYGLYMYHLIIMYVLLNHLFDKYYLDDSFIGIYLLLSLIGTVSIASISYYFIEKPLLKLKPEA